MLAQAFKKLSNGLASLADTAESFESKMVPGLLRSAPDLAPNIKNVQAMFKKQSEGQDSLLSRAKYDPHHLSR